jgi:hypothetical protein
MSLHQKCLTSLTILTLLFAQSCQSDKPKGKLSNLPLNLSNPKNIPIDAFVNKAKVVFLQFTPASAISNVISIRRDGDLLAMLDFDMQADRKDLKIFTTQGQYIRTLAGGADAGKTHYNLSVFSLYSSEIAHLVIRRLTLTLFFPSSLLAHVPFKLFV